MRYPPEHATLLISIRLLSNKILFIQGKMTDLPIFLRLQVHFQFSRHFSHENDSETFCPNNKIFIVSMYFIHLPESGIKNG
jgi:hypothetical protein